MTTTIDYDDIVASVSDGQLRAQVNNYFSTRLPEDYIPKEEREARSDVIRRHWRFFSRTLPNIGKEPATDMPLVCERFRVVYR